MIVNVEQSKLLVHINDATAEHGRIILPNPRRHFPADCFGPSNAKSGLGKMLHLTVEGLSEPVLTDIPKDLKTGRPRPFFRDRGWVNRFIKRHRLKSGDQVVIERLGSHDYRIYPKSNHPNEKGHPRVAEFFAGIGLVRLALDNTGFHTVFANDIAPEKLEMYRANFDEDGFTLGDIHKLKPSDIPDCDLATASFPCTDLSIAGAMAGLGGQQSGAFWGFMKLIEGMAERRPPLILLENVPGFIMSNNGEDFEAALSALNRLGYACDSFMIDASDFVPQSRLRLFVVAKLGVEGSYPFGIEPSELRPRLLVDFMATHSDIRWDVRSLPKLPTRTKTLEDIFEDLPHDDPAWWSQERADYFVSQLSERHSAIAHEMIRKSRYSYGTAFRRVRNGRSMAELRVDGTAGCLRTPRGGSARQILFKAGRGRYWVRLLTARECARLQGVPDSYKIDVPLNQALFGFGDAVCVPVIEWISREYLLPNLAEIRHSAGTLAAK